jgi:hypothetical protein
MYGLATSADADVVAYDMVSSTSQNLISFTDDPAIPFTSNADGFQKFQRGISTTIPFAVLDDSAGSFPSDTLGIIKTSNTDEFFGIVDTNNPDTGGSDVVSTWVFDISGASNLSLAIDMGAMGDFEAASDFFNWSYSIDGGSAQTAFKSSVDEAVSQTYTLESGTEVTLNDPMLVNGVLLNNNLQTQTVALAGSGNQLTLVLTANTNSGSEAVAFQDIAINIVDALPVCDDAYPSIDSLWPPNHKFVSVNVLGVTDPDGDPVTITIDSIFQDEPVDDRGDGKFVPDGKGVGTDTASVRAERSGSKKVPGNGRVYHIGYTADDGLGGSCSGHVMVAVPHDQNAAVVDDGALYDSTVP